MTSRGCPCARKLLKAALVWLLATSVGARVADAYIDPGTGSAMFGSLLPILGMIGVVLVSALTFARGYVRFVLSSLWRRRMWLLILAVGLLIGAGVYIVVG